MAFRNATLELWALISNPDGTNKHPVRINDTTFATPTTSGALTNAMVYNIGNEGVLVWSMCVLEGTSTNSDNTVWIRVSLNVRTNVGSVATDASSPFFIFIEDWTGGSHFAMFPGKRVPFYDAINSPWHNYTYVASITNSAASGNVSWTLTPGAGGCIEILGGVLGNFDNTRTITGQLLDNSNDLIYNFLQQVNLPVSSYTGIPSLGVTTGVPSKIIPAFAAGGQKLVLTAQAVSAGAQIYVALQIRFKGDVPAIIGAGAAGFSTTLLTGRTENG
jgi:hypothetical protein